MFTKGQRVRVSFQDGELHLEGKVLAVPGETWHIYGNDTVLDEGEYRVWYTQAGYGYECTVLAERLQPFYDRVI